MMQVFQALFYLAVPAASLWICARSSAANALGAVALCYAFGILLGNVAELDGAFAMNFGGAALLLAIPLLLFTVDLPGWARAASTTLKASLIAFLSVGTVAVIAGYLFREIAFAPEIAGGLAAVYTGGTPSLIATLKALQVPPDVLVAVNLSDVVVAGPFYFVLSSFGHRFFGLFLRIPEPLPNDDPLAVDESALKITIFDRMPALGLAAVVAALGGAVTLVAPKELQDVLAILIASTLALSFSLSPKVRNLPGSFTTGEYLLLVFCTGIGSLTNLSLLAQADMRIVGFTATIFFCSQIVQYSLFYLFKIDRNLAMMASIASVYSPAFVAPVALRLRSKSALVAGVTIGLVGYAIAVYLGVAVSMILHRL